MKNQHPEWALAHKKKGTELRCIRGKYYLYQISSKWDKDLKRSKKITGACLGTISQDGFTPSKPKDSFDLSNKQIGVKMFAGADYFMSLFAEFIPHLKRCFPDKWKVLLSIACIRLFYKAPIKSMNLHFENSFLSETFSSIPFSDKFISKTLHELGGMQSVIDEFLKVFITSEHIVLIDATPIFTQSNNIYEAKMGYNNKKRWDTQVNLLYLYDYSLSLPLYYRVIQGDIREIRTLGLTIQSAGLKGVIIVGDKGFSSETNIEFMRQNELNYILPLRRNSSLIDYKDVDSKSKLGGYFKYKERYIWYKTKDIEEDKRLIIFLDEGLKLSEESDYLDRIAKFPEEYSEKNFYKDSIRMGTISTIDNNLKKTPEEIYFIYKSRCEIEQLFDIYKNTLNADRTYMHSHESLLGWMFINHLAIIAYYKIYQTLKDKNLISKHSVEDIINNLLHINAININGVWKLQEVAQKTIKLLEKINYNMPITCIRES